MGDLSVLRGDRPSHESVEKARGNGAAVDRARLSGDRLHRWTWLLLCGCAATAPGERAGRELEVWRAERWVDASAPPGGDGSRERPWKGLPARVTEGAWLHLRAGLYRGPLALEPGARLTGHGTAVVFVEGSGAVVTAKDARLEVVSVQGGSVGLDVEGRVEADDLRLSGQRGVAVRVGQGGRASLSRLTVVGVAGGDGVAVGEGGAVEVRDGRFSGALSRAVKLERAEGRLEAVSSEGPATLVHAVDSRLTLDDAASAAGRSAAVFVSGGALRARHLSVLGHEYALLAVRARLDVEDLRSRGAQLGGLAVDRCTGRLAAVHIEGAGSLGSVQLLGSEVILEDAEVRRGAALGVLVRHGAVSIGRLRVDTVRAEGGTAVAPVLGDALHVRDATVTLGRLEVLDVEGAALFLGAAATVRASEVEAHRSVGGGVVAERGARLELRRLVVDGARGPAVLATEGATVEVEELEASGSEVPVWAECAQGASVRLGVLRWVGELPPSRCVMRMGPRGE